MSQADTEIKYIDDTHTYRADNGHAATLTVLDASSTPIGWIDTRQLGFENVKAYLAELNSP